MGVVGGDESVDFLRKQSADEAVGEDENEQLGEHYSDESSAFEQLEGLGQV